MKKLILNLMLILIFFSTFNPTMFSLATPNKDSQSNTLDFWYVEDDIIDGTLLGLIEDFEIESGLTVNATRFSENEAKELFKSSYLEEVEPDLILGPSTWIPELVSNSMISPIEETQFLEEYMDDAKRAVSYYEIIDNVIQSSSILYYGFPYSTDVQAYAYNKDIAASMGAIIPEIGTGWTIDEFKTALTKMTDQSDPVDKKFGFSFTELPNAVEPIFYGMGGLKFRNLTLDKGHVDIQSDKSIETLQFIYDVVNKYRLTPAWAEQGVTKTFNNIAINGSVASTFLFSSELKHYLLGDMFTDASNMGIAQTPIDEGATGTPLHVKTIMISSQSQNQNDAIELAQYLTSENAMFENAVVENILPAIWSVFDDETLDSSILQDYKIVLENAKIMPISKYWIPIQADFAVEVGEMLNGDQNGSVAARALNIKWSFILPLDAGYPPIGPVEIPVDTNTSTDTDTSNGDDKETPWPLTSVIFAIGSISVISIIKKRGYKG